MRSCVVPNPDDFLSQNDARQPHVTTYLLHLHYIMSDDPPPPYPSRDRRRSIRTSRRQLPPHPDPDPAGEINDTTPLLPASNNRLSTVFRSGRPRSPSHTSVASAAPSLAQTVISLFHDCDDDPDAGYDILSDSDRLCDHHPHQQPAPARWSLFSRSAWRRYFRPISRKVYYTALFHLLVLNFPYALAAWIYLFVFTLASSNF